MITDERGHSRLDPKLLDGYGNIVFMQLLKRPFYPAKHERAFCRHNGPACVLLSFGGALRIIETNVLVNCTIMVRRAIGTTLSEVAGVSRTTIVSLDLFISSVYTHFLSWIFRPRLNVVASFLAIASGPMRQ